MKDFIFNSYLIKFIYRLNNIRLISFHLIVVFDIEGLLLEAILHLVMPHSRRSSLDAIEPLRLPKIPLHLLVLQLTPIKLYYRLSHSLLLLLYFHLVLLVHIVHAWLLLLWWGFRLIVRKAGMGGLEWGFINLNFL